MDHNARNIVERSVGYALKASRPAEQLPQARFYAMKQQLADMQWLTTTNMTQLISAPGQIISTTERLVIDTAQKIIPFGGRAALNRLVPELVEAVLGKNTEHSERVEYSIDHDTDDVPYLSILQVFQDKYTRATGAEQTVQISYWQGMLPPIRFAVANERLASLENALNQ